MIQNDLHELAAAFRGALETAAFDAQHGNLRDFPDRCCDHASILFGIHLLSEGHGPPRLVYASRGTEHERRHVWLIVDGLIVDLAADQFEGEGQPPVIVAQQSGEERGRTSIPPIEVRPLFLLHLLQDFIVAPVYFKEASRTEALLCVYFMALVLQMLLDRELREAMKQAGLESLPLYPGGRPC